MTNILLNLLLTYHTKDIPVNPFKMVYENMSYLKKLLSMSDGLFVEQIVRTPDKDWTP